MKTKLNGQNLLMLNRMDLLPEETEELKFSSRVFNFTQYLKLKQYKLDERAIAFLDEINYPHDGEGIEKETWKFYYDVHMEPIKRYLKEHQEELLKKVNDNIYSEWREKYFSENRKPYWEIEGMGINFTKFPLTGVYGITDFTALSQEPEPASFFMTKTGRQVPIYNISVLVGVVIAKDKLHSSITLLTEYGPVEVKFRKEQFAHYDAQISRVENGKKKVVEKSWFNRGTPILVAGMRRDDTFIAKVYKNSPMDHTVYKVLGRNPEDESRLLTQKDRLKGTKEESNNESEE